MNIQAGIGSVGGAVSQAAQGAQQITGMDVATALGSFLFIVSAVVTSVVIVGGFLWRIARPAVNEHIRKTAATYTQTTVNGHTQKEPTLKDGVSDLKRNQELILTTLSAQSSDILTIRQVQNKMKDQVDRMERVQVSQGLDITALEESSSSERRKLATPESN